MRPREVLSRLSVKLEPRDVWVGLYVSPKALYACPMPMLVIRWQR